MQQELLDYINFVNEQVEKYKKNLKLIDENVNEVTPHMINTALSSYGTINLMLIAEYNRKKTEFRQVEMDYEEWWDEKFSTMRKEMQEGIESKSVKIGMKEVEIEVRVKYKEEYKEWQSKLFKAEQQISFFQRLLDLWKRMDNTLTQISFNMRSELKSLSLDNRLNYQKAVMGSMDYKKRKPVD
jgi:hypothetical protein